MYKEGIIDFSNLKESYQGWQVYAKWGNTYKLRESVKKEIIDTLWKKV